MRKLFDFSLGAWILTIAARSVVSWLGRDVCDCRRYTMTVEI